MSEYGEGPSFDRQRQPEQLKLHLEEMAESVRNAAALLRRAQTTVVQRDGEYGDAAATFGLAATLWAAYLNAFVGPADVAACMVLLKLARIANGKADQTDSWTDIAGYAALGESLDKPV